MNINISNLGNRVVNQYILELANKELIIIDTGYSGGFKRFRDRFESNGFNKTNIRFLVLTHAHDDHAGFLNELLDYCNAPLILHEEAIERLKFGQNSFNGGCSSRIAYIFCLIMKFLGKGEHLFPKVNRVERYIPLQQNPNILKDNGYPIDLITLPGHTEDSIGLIFNKKVFCGDAAMNGFPSICKHTIWIENKSDFVRSWDKMMEHGVETIFPSHGKPFSSKKLKKFRDYLNGKKLIPLKKP